MSNKGVTIGAAWLWRSFGCAH